MRSKGIYVDFRQSVVFRRLILPLIKESDTLFSLKRRWLVIFRYTIG